MKTCTIQENPNWSPGTYPVNYWAIFNELLARAQSVEQQRVMDRTNLSIPRLVREFRTIGFTGVRQSGKTRWVCDFLNRYPKAVAIVTNQEYKKELLRSRDMAGYEIPHITEADLQRVFTAKEIHSRYREKGIQGTRFPEALLNADFIVVDESYYVYRKVTGFSSQSLESIIAQHFDHLPIVVEVN